MPHLAGLHCGVQGQVLGVTIDVFSPSVGYMEPSGTVKDGHMEKSPGRFEIDLFFFMFCSQSNHTLQQWGLTIQSSHGG